MNVHAFFVGAIIGVIIGIIGAVNNWKLFTTMITAGVLGAAAGYLF